MSEQRESGIDALRAALTILVVFHHAAITYGGGGGWYYREVAQGGARGTWVLDFFCAINQSYFMGLFFLIAGYFTPRAVERHGACGYLRERLSRLGLPLLFYLLLLSPVTIALAAIAKGRPFLKSLVYAYIHGLMEPGPLWFAEALLIFAALYVAAKLLAPGRFEFVGPATFPSNGTLLLAAIGVGAVAFALRLVWPIGVQPLGLQLGFFASYVVLFSAGCKAAWLPSLDGASERQRLLWRRIAWVTLPVLPAIVILGNHDPAFGGTTDGGWNARAIVYAFWEPFLAWGTILTLLHGFTLRFITLGPLWAQLSRRAYAVYIIHPPVLVGIALAWRGVDAPPLIKFPITGTAACLACFLLAGLLLRSPTLRRVL